jgi:hypothetical protein
MGEPLKLRAIGAKFRVQDATGRWLDDDVAIFGPGATLTVVQPLRFRGEDGFDFSATGEVHIVLQVEDVFYEQPPRVSVPLWRRWLSEYRRK